MSSAACARYTASPFPRLRSPFTIRQIPAGFPSRNSSGSRLSGASCQQTARANRSIARPPTDVLLPSEVAGNGPPWTIAWHTSTPVGTPRNRIRPAFVSSARGQRVGCRFVSRRRENRRRQVPFHFARNRDHFFNAVVTNQKRARAEHFLGQIGRSLKGAASVSKSAGAASLIRVRKRPRSDAPVAARAAVIRR